MSKTQKLFYILSKLFTNPSCLRKLFDEEDVYKNHVIKNYRLQNGFPVIDLLDLIPAFNETIDPYSFLDGTSGVIDLALLKALAKKFSANSYLEIGTWRGESVANVASVAKECITVNLSDKDILSSGLPIEYVNLHRFFSKDISNVSYLQANSLEFNFNSLQKKFDLIFVDGDHHYQSVKSDTQKMFSILNDEHSIIVWHDYAFSPCNPRWTVMAGILDGSPPENRKNIYAVSNTMCAVYINGNFKTHMSQQFIKPDKKFHVTIKAERI